MEENTAPATVAGVERALDVIEAFTETGVADLGVTEIADRLGLSKAVVHRLLSTFRARGYLHLAPDTRRYELGTRALTLGLAYLDKVDAAGLARRALRDLSARTGETATMSVRVDWSRVYIEQVTPARDIKMVVTLGGAYPLHAGASSKAMLASLSEETVEAYLATNELRPLTEHTITDPGQLRAELARIRSRGYASSFGERQPDAGSVSAAIRDRAGRSLAVLSVCGPVERFRGEEEEAARAIIEVTSEVSTAIGYMGQDHHT